MSNNLAATIVSAVVPAGVISAVPLPPGAPEWLGWVGAFIGAVVAPLLMRAGPRIIAGRRAKKKALAAAERDRAAAESASAQKLLTDGDKGNDGEARVLLLSAHKRLDKADAYDAEVAELDAISGAVPKAKGGEE